MSESELCCKRNLEDGELAACVCGCGDTTSNFFAPGHDERLRSFIRGNDHAALNSVLWCSVPLCFNYRKENGDYAVQIKGHRRIVGCTDTSEIMPRWDIPCQYE